jgi:hypothetical protein
VGEESRLATAGLVAGDVLVYTAKGPIRGLQDLRGALRELPVGQDLRIQVIGQRDGKRRFVSLPTALGGGARGHAAIPEVPEIPDTKAMIDDMLQRAIRQVVPTEGGMIVPGTSSGEAGQGTPPEPERRKKRLRAP